MDKKGLSGVVTVVILVALVMAATSIVWIVVKNLVDSQLQKTSCLEVFEKVTINSLYTCYNRTSNEFQFSISIGDIDIDGVLVAISGGGETKSFKITNEPTDILNLKPYGEASGNVVLPKKNAGLTYIYDGFSEKPDLIKIAPIINKNQCEVSDLLSEIDICL